MFSRTLMYISKAETREEILKKMFVIPSKMRNSTATLQLMHPNATSRHKLYTRHQTKYEKGTRCKGHIERTGASKFLIPKVKANGGHDLKSAGNYYISRVTES